MTVIRPAALADADAMTQLLNEIIEVGGTTANTELYTVTKMRASMADKPEKSAWHVAEDDGEIIGFQFVIPDPGLPAEAVDISTFTKIGLVQRGTGTKLFAATVPAARALGYAWINANIRADNTGGLRYYTGRGFVDYGTKIGVELPGGLVVDKVLKRFDL